ncbi:ABC transporter ATP-binding protein [Paracraurococcus ruber]|uniref:ABC transporter ATP-binding protein n=1 Tax=Paracraurococcus ruber TaxID=77675 RepID=A0ABS1CVT3_9PROT|nr:ABC transporter ATP-binding protein [Paracraurococcus ruber]MBK1658617.1 ABC transporter ATP-binding protein [Paracraurococcus ruber]TDG30810.1 ABC transporter ATP-binding protein [Paracraurococcus ruber]
MAEPLLSLQGVSAGHGEAVVLQDISLQVAPGEAVALLGRNGTGKTTLITTVMGAGPRLRAGSIRFAGQDIARLPSERRAALGLGWVPQERNVFRSLTVEENLTAVARPGPWTLARVMELFPRLAERRRNLGSALSGGEQQMLAMGRALMLNPRLVLLDEPLEGLAPVIVQGLLAAIRRMVREDGLAAVIVEQHARLVLPITDRAVILDRGRIVHAGGSDALLAAPEVAERHLGLNHV